MPEIVYQSERATLYRGDAATVIDVMPRRLVHAIITDPPYGVQWQSNYRSVKFDRMAGDVSGYDVLTVIAAYVNRILTRQRHVYVFGATADQLRSAITTISAATELIWNKCHMGMGDLSLPWGPAHERIAFGVHIPSVTERANGRGTLSARLRRGSVLSYPRKSGRAITRHPTEKPVPLMRDLIESSTRLDETVCDPFAGSGSTLVAAVLAGRKTVGVEIDPQYCRVAVDRLKAAEKVAEAAQCC